MSSVGGVLGLRFADRIGKGFREVPRDAIISLSTPSGQMGHALLLIGYAVIYIINRVTKKSLMY